MQKAIDNKKLNKVQQLLTHYSPNWIDKNKIQLAYLVPELWKTLLLNELDKSKINLFHPGIRYQLLLSKELDDIHSIICHKLTHSYKHDPLLSQFKIPRSWNTITYTTIHLACIYNNHVLLKQLLQDGVDPHVPIKFLERTHSFQTNPRIHMIKTIPTIYLTTSQECLKLLIEYDARLWIGEGADMESVHFSNIDSIKIMSKSIHWQDNHWLLLSKTSKDPNIIKFCRQQMDPNKVVGANVLSNMLTEDEIIGVLSHGKWIKMFLVNSAICNTPYHRIKAWQDYFKLKFYFACMRARGVPGYGRLPVPAMREVCEYFRPGPLV